MIIPRTEQNLNQHIIQETSLLSPTPDIVITFNMHRAKYLKRSQYIFTLTNQSELIPESWEEYLCRVGFVAPATNALGSLDARKSLAAEC